MSRRFALLRRRDWRRDFERAWRRNVAASPALDAEALESVRSDLAAHMARWSGLDRDEGRLACRNQIMDSIERLCLQRGLQDLDAATRDRVTERLAEFRDLDRDLSRRIAAEALRIDTLRDWSGRYYGDRGRHDWYETYRRAAEMRMESIRRDFERIAGLPVHVAQNHRDAAMRGLNAALRLRLLQLPAGRSVTHRSLRTRLRQLFKNGDPTDEHDG